MIELRIKKSTLKKKNGRFSAKMSFAEEDTAMCDAPILDADAMTLTLFHPHDNYEAYMLENGNDEELRDGIEEEATDALRELKMDGAYDAVVGKCLDTADMLLIDMNDPADVIVARPVMRIVVPLEKKDGSPPDALCNNHESVCPTVDTSVVETRSHEMA